MVVISSIYTGYLTPVTCIIEIGENNNEVGYSTKTENRIIVGFKIMNKYREDAEDDDGCENYPINFNKRHERLHIFSAFGLFVCCQLRMFVFSHARSRHLVQQLTTVPHLKFLKLIQH